jgi:ribosomal-protein-alanine N-acetyltransferase
MLPEVENISIQRMNQADIEEVIRLEKLCFSDPWSKSSFEHELINRFSVPLVVKSNTRIVGYLCLWHIYEQMEIATIGVSPEFRRKGIGGKMMNWILKEAKKGGCSNVILSVRESNNAAINLYRKFGFVELERRKKYYRLPEEDAIVMIKPL